MTRMHVSIRGDTFYRFRDAARARGLSMTQLLDQLVADILDGSGADSAPSSSEAPPSGDDGAGDVPERSAPRDGDARDAVRSVQDAPPGSADATHVGGAKASVQHLLKGQLRDGRFRSACGLALARYHSPWILPREEFELAERRCFACRRIAKRAA